MAHRPARPSWAMLRPFLRLVGAVVGGVLALGTSAVRAAVTLALAPLFGPGRPRLLTFPDNRAVAEDPVAAAAAFVREFEEAYGAQHPSFLQCSYLEALQHAQRDSKFLLLYLHAAEHQSTPAFCSQTLCSAPIAEFIDANVLCWGGDVRHREAFQLSGTLRNATYPYLALVLLSTGSRPSLVAAFEGFVTADRLLHLLAQAIEDHGATLMVARAEEEERNFNRQLRAEQDAEYEASLRADQERAAREEELQRAAARELAEREAQQAAEAAALAEAERVAQEQAAALAARRAAKASALAPEPPVGPGVNQIVLRLPDGSRLQRRFVCDTATVADLYDWAEAEGVQSSSFSLVTSFPRVVYPREGKTLQEVGLLAQTALLVEAGSDT